MKESPVSSDPATNLISTSKEKALPRQDILTENKEALVGPLYTADQDILINQESNNKSLKRKLPRKKNNILDKFRKF